MKQLLGGILCVCLTSFGWGETLALTVHNDNGDPGEAHSIWTETYYVDDQGRLVRTHRVIQGEFIGDPEINQDTVYHWETGRVWWSGVAPGEIKFSEILHISDADAERTEWRSTRFEYHWSKQAGFSQNFRPEFKGTEGPGFRYTTDGSRLSEWTGGGFENQRILLNKTPSRLFGTYVQQNENLDGWIATGEVWASGTGVWHRDLRTRLIHAMLLEQNGVLYFTAPFVFEEKYLK